MQCKNGADHIQSLRDGRTVYIDGQHFTTLKGNYDALAAAFRALVDDYVATKYPRREIARTVPV